MFSLGWRFESGVAGLEGLSLAIGVVLARVLERHGVRPLLKWPNDVLLETSEGKLGKLAGILVEMSGDAAGPCEVVVGMGINVDLPNSFRASIDQPVAAVQDHAPDLTRHRLAVELLDALLPLMAKFEEDGFAAWQAEWNVRHAFAGCEVDIVMGTRRETGVAEGVDALGGLWIRQQGDRLRLSGGEISVRGRP